MIFEIETPQGRFEVDAPDQETAIRALSGQAAPQAAPAPETPAQPERGFMRRVDDAARGAADMSSFGFADEISAGLGSLTGLGGKRGDYEGNLAAQRQRDSEGGWERFGGQVLGAVAMPGAAAKTLMSAVGKGMLGGAAYGFGSGEGNAVERLPSAAVGGVTGGVAGGVVRAGANLLGNRAASKLIPTNEQLKTDANASYRAADNAGVIFKPQGIKRMANDIRVDLAEFGFHPKLQPRVAVVLDELERLQTGNVTLKGMDVLRRIADSARKSMDPSEKALGNQIITRIDDFMMDARPGDILTGNADAAGKAIRTGRDLWGRMRKSEMVDLAALKAERRAASTGSGGNADNALRQNVRGLLDSPKLSRGMSQTEKKAAERVVRGSVPQNLLRGVGKMAPTGIVSGGIGSSMGAAAGAMVGGPAGAAVGSFALPALGQIAKTAADRMTVKNAERLSQIIRSGGRSSQDLAALARGGKLAVPQIRRIEALAKMLGVSVPVMAAAVADRVY